MLSALSDSLLDILRSETSEVARGEVGTSVGKDSGTCIMWEKDFAGAKLSLVKRVSLNGKMPVVENAECRSLGVIDRRHISMYSWMIL
jgi:hypothetical protein